MEILVLGDSDTSGRFTGGVSWPQLLQASLGKRLEQPVSVHTRGLSAVPPDAWKYAEKCVAEMKPDSVVLLVGTSVAIGSIVTGVLALNSGTRYETANDGTNTASTQSMARSRGTAVSALPRRTASAIDFVRRICVWMFSTPAKMSRPSTQPK